MALSRVLQVALLPDTSSSYNETKEKQKTKNSKLNLVLERKGLSTNERSLFAKEQKVDNGRLPVEAEAHQSWPPTKKFKK